LLPVYMKPSALNAEGFFYLTYIL